MENNNKSISSENIQVVANSASPSKIAKLIQNWPVNKKIIFLILGLVVLFELIIMLKALLIKPQVPVIERPQTITGAKIILDSSKTSFEIGEEVVVDVRIATGGHTTDGVDLVLQFDNKILEATGSGVFVPGKIYTEYPPLIVSRDKGEIRVSGLTGSEADSFIGVGVFGQVKLKAIANGSTKISIDFQKPGATVDSNVTETKTAKDLLEKTYDLSVNVGNSANNNSTKTASISCQKFIQICQDELGDPGTQVCTQGARDKNRVCSWDPYLTTDCTICQSSQSP